MTTKLSLLSSFAKAAEILAALHPILFFNASLLNDTVHRIGDFLDNGKSDWRN